MEKPKSDEPKKESQWVTSTKGAEKQAQKPEHTVGKAGVREMRQAVPADPIQQRGLGCCSEQACLWRVHIWAWLVQSGAYCFVSHFPLAHRDRTRFPLLPTRAPTSSVPSGSSFSPLPLPVCIAQGAREATLSCEALVWSLETAACTRRTPHGTLGPLAHRRPASQVVCL